MTETPPAETTPDPNAPSTPPDAPDGPEQAPQLAEGAMGTEGTGTPADAPDAGEGEPVMGTEGTGNQPDRGSDQGDVPAGDRDTNPPPRDPRLDELAPGEELHPQ